PIFYPLHRIDEKYQPILRLNPLTQVVQDVRGILLEGDDPVWSWWFFSLAASAIIALFGYAFFMKSKRAFADVV
ncbi:MAG: ABC transporter permease, partial [Planctomycetota bacterium]